MARDLGGSRGAGPDELRERLTGGQECDHAGVDGKIRGTQHGGGVRAYQVSEGLDPGTAIAPPALLERLSKAGASTRVTSCIL